MSYRRLVEHFSSETESPVAINRVLQWITANTDHNDITLHPVVPKKSSFFGALRRRAHSVGMYSQDYEIKTDILYADNLPPEMKRLVICKELLHIFDVNNLQVHTREKVQELIPAILLPSEAMLKMAPDSCARRDIESVLRAMAVLLPRATRLPLAKAVSEGRRSLEDAADWVHLPIVHVDIWLRLGDELEESFLGNR